ncbi:tetratricopeptide repeat protein [Parabacteroides sp.]
MKKQYTLLNLLFLIAIFSCTGSGNISSVLERAEECMNTRSDSALFLLKNVSQPEKLPSDQYALWCLLITQAQDKEYIKHTSDSLINVAVDYFDQGHNALRKAQARYCQGRVFMDLLRFDQAIESFLKAEDYLQKTADHNLQARICNQLGDLYRRNTLYDKSLTYYQKAHSCYVKDNYLMGVAYTLRDIGISYEYLGKLDSSIFSLNQSLELAQKHKWSGLKASVLNCLGNTYTEKALYPEAIDYICAAMRMMPDNNRLYSLCYSLGQLYKKVGRNDSALFYLNKAINSSNLYTKCQSYREYSLLSYQNKDYKAAFDSNDQYLIFRDSIEQVYQSGKIVEIEARYNYEKAINEKNQLLLKKKDNEFFFLLVVIVLLILLSFVIYLYQSHLHEKQLILQKKEQDLQIYSQRLSESRLEIYKSQTSLAQKEKELQEKVDEMQANMKKIQTLETDKQQIEKMYSLQNEELNKEIAILQGEIKEKISSIKNMKQKSVEFVRKYFESHYPQINKLYDKKEIVMEYSEKDWEDFESTFNDVYPEYIVRLNKKCPKITKNEQRYCCLFILGIKAEKISAVLGVEPNTVSKYRKGIIKKNFPLNKDISFEDFLDSMTQNPFFL